MLFLDSLLVHICYVNKRSYTEYGPYDFFSVQNMRITCTCKYIYILFYQILITSMAVKGQKIVNIQDTLFVIFERMTIV